MQSGGDGAAPKAATAPAAKAAADSSGTAAVAAKASSATADGGTDRAVQMGDTEPAAGVREAVPAPVATAVRPTPQLRDSPDVLSDREFDRILSDVGHMTLLQMRLLCSVLHQYPGTALGGTDVAVQFGDPAPRTAEQAVQTRIRQATTAVQTEAPDVEGAAAGPMRAAGSGEDPRAQATSGCRRGCARQRHLSDSSWHMETTRSIRMTSAGWKSQSGLGISQGLGRYYKRYAGP